jgi:hypothetical protein
MPVAPLSFMSGTCHRCGSSSLLFPLQGKRYCRPCVELSFRSVSRYRLIDRRDPSREPRGYGRRWTDVLTKPPGADS